MTENKTHEIMFALGRIEGYLHGVAKPVPDFIIEDIDNIRDFVGGGKVIHGRPIEFNVKETEEKEVGDYGFGPESDEDKVAKFVENNGVTKVKVKRKNNWTPERREAAAQRMRDRQAAGLMHRKGHVKPIEKDEPFVLEDDFDESSVGGGATGNVEAPQDGAQEDKYDPETGLKIDSKMGALVLF